MKYINFLLSLLILIFLGCSGTDKVKDNGNKGIGADMAKQDIYANSSNPESAKTLRFAYVLSRDGTNYKQLPKPEAPVLGKLEYGDRVDVIKDTIGWVGIRIPTYLGQKLAWIKKNETGSISEISIDPKDLTAIDMLHINGDTADLSKKISINKYLQISFIDEKEYSEQKQKSEKYFLTDTTLFRKKKGVLTLKTERGFMKLTDIPGDSEASKTYEYVGQYSFLNKYIVSGSYY